MERITPRECAADLGITIYLFRKLAYEGQLPFVLVTGKQRKTIIVQKERYEQWKKASVK